MPQQPFNAPINDIMQAIQAADAQFARMQQQKMSMGQLALGQQQESRLGKSQELQDLLNRAKTLSETEAGGEIEIPGLGKIPVPGIARRGELSAAQAEKTAAATTKGQLGEQLDLTDKLNEKVVKQAEAKLKAIGITPGMKDYNSALAKELGIPEQVETTIGGRTFKLTVQEAAKIAAQLESARLQGQNRITIENMRQAGKGQLSPAQETALSEMKKSADDFDQVTKLLEPAKSQLGYFTRRKQAGQLAAGGEAKKEFLNLSIAINRLRNKLLKVRSGAAVTDQEMRRIANELPNLGMLRSDSYDTIKAKLESGLADVQRAIEIFQQTAAPGGNPTVTIQGHIANLPEM